KWEPTCTGRSPVLLTFKVQVRRPALSSIGSPSKKYSPGFIGVCLSVDGLMNGDEFGAVGKGGFHLDFGNHFRDAVHDIILGENCVPGGHYLGHALAVASHFEELGGDHGDRLGMVQLESTRLASAGQLARHEDQQLVALFGG